MPAIEVGQRPGRSHKMISQLMQGRCVELKTEKFKTVFANKRIDRWNCNTRFTHMKQKVAAFARAEKIGKACHAGQRRLQQFLPAMADFGRR